MTKDRYIDLFSPTDLQIKIMKHIDHWVKTEKTPISKQEIVKKMTQEGIKEPTVNNAINTLIKMGYIRRGVLISNKTIYVQLRRV